MSAQKYAEVVGTPYQVYVAPVGTVFPKVQTAPANAWVPFGTNGVNNQASKGVTIGLADTISSFKPAGGTLKVKDWRTEEDPTVSFAVVDTTVEQLSLVLDGATVTSVSAGTGIAGEKSLKLIRGIQVAYFALLVRGLSPYDDGTGLNAQWEFTRVCQTGSQSLTYVAGTPAEVECDFSIRGDVVGVDPAIYRAQNAAPTA